MKTKDILHYDKHISVVAYLKILGKISEAIKMNCLFIQKLQ